MELELLNIDRSQVRVNSAEILPLLGVASGDIDTHTGELIKKYIAECEKIMSPRGGFATFEAKVVESKDEIEIEGTRFHTGKILRIMLQRAEEYAFFVVTAGPGPETLARELIDDGQYLEGYIVDLIGSGIVESVANQVHQHIRDLAESRGMNVTNRYSPGYCSWNVSEQQKLFRLLPEGYCGIVLSDSSLMSPIKSLSGIIGIGASVMYKDYTCEICSMKDCLFRRTAPLRVRPSKA
ncbi:MAG: methionine synthase [Bacteroidales bacterium]|nr:methionine synthase [Bacteroidales bacterium]